MITVLRLGHRCGRDARISTHVGLTSRTLGVKKVIYSGDKDKKVMDSVRDIDKRWGSSIDVSYEKNWKKIIESFEGVKVHLTIYGLLVQDKIDEIRGKSKDKGDILIIVGGEKVPPFVYQNVDYNIAITSQPHSEIAALAIFLDMLQQGKELDKEFVGGEIKVKPCSDGKDVVQTNN
ncbi:tRNA (cytidine(56)-2'-O)-methyltransferase [archaeon]|nr:tRNA (cytidine(56)-2'-O)-methyltransferase [archaeon]|tara:strand:+ start:2348 stop:2878 length:531 start_codon:yes stop_codon:yes gene_type:complete